MSEFESHWVPHSFGLVPHRSKELCKLPYKVAAIRPPTTYHEKKTRTRHTGYCWRSRDELIRDVLLWNPSPGRAKARRPARTYIQQLSEDMGCIPEDLPEAMNDWEKWQERVRDIRADGTTRWWDDDLSKMNVKAKQEFEPVYFVTAVQPSRYFYFTIFVPEVKVTEILDWFGFMTYEDH